MITLPLASLPIGAQVFALRPHAYVRSWPDPDEQLTVIHTYDGCATVANRDGDVWRSVPFDLLVLDLSPPPLIDGWPAHVDGLTIARDLLGRAMGLDNPRFGHRDEDGRRIWSIGDGARTIEFPPWSGPREESWDGVIEIPLPALASIDPADPLADRLAMRAIVLAQPWRSDV